MDLAAERAGAAERLADLRRQHAGLVEASEGSNADDEHDPEGQTIAFERAQLAALVDLAAARVAELDDALGRVAAGSYGTCAACGQPVGEERLAARPSARTCVTCARGPARGRGRAGWRA